MLGVTVGATTPTAVVVAVALLAVFGPVRHTVTLGQIDVLFVLPFVAAVGLSLLRAGSAPVAGAAALLVLPAMFAPAASWGGWLDEFGNHPSDPSVRWNPQWSIALALPGAAVLALLLGLALLWLLPKTRSWAEGRLLNEDDEDRRRPRKARVDAGRVNEGRVIAGRGAGDDPVPVI